MENAIRVIYENADFLAIHKPAGLLVHGTKDSHEPSVVDWLIENYPEVRTVGDDPAVRPGIVHRLDKGTSGVMLVAKTQAYFEYLKKKFQTREIKKTYLAAVCGRVKEKEGVIDKPIGIASGTLKRTIHSDKFVKPAITRYAVVGYKDISGQIFSMLKVMPETGRTHQIRVHMASMHHPVAGDALYGRKKDGVVWPRLMLHAFSIEFTAEDGKRIKIEAEPPQDFLAWRHDAIN